MKAQEYLQRFFEEKELEEKVYAVEHGRNLHFIESGIVIDLIMESHPIEQEQIANVLRIIDFHNGDVHHFLNHLAKGFIKTHC